MVSRLSESRQTFFTARDLSSTISPASLHIRRAQAANSVKMDVLDGPDERAIVKEPETSMEREQHNM